MGEERVGIVTDADFSTTISKGEAPVLVEFWASWCGPCKLMVPVIQETAGILKGRVKVARMNVDENSEVPAAYQVKSIPMVILFVQGQEVLRAIGFKTQRELLDLINPHLK